MDLVEVSCHNCERKFYVPKKNRYAVYCCPYCGMMSISYGGSEVECPYTIQFGANLRCVLCGERRAMINSLICTECLREVSGWSLKKYTLMRMVYDYIFKQEGYVGAKKVSEALKLHPTTVYKYLKDMEHKFGLLESKRVLNEKMRWERVWRVVG